MALNNDTPQQAKNFVQVSTTMLDSNTFDQSMPENHLPLTEALNSSFLDHSRMASNISIFHEDFSPDLQSATIPSLRLKIASAKIQIHDLSNDICDLSTTIQQYLALFPPTPVSRIEDPNFRPAFEKAIGICNKAQDLAIPAKHAWNEITQFTRFVQGSLEREYNILSNEVRDLEAARTADWEVFRRNGPNMFVPEQFLRGDFEKRWAPRLQGKAKQAALAMSGNQTALTFAVNAAVWTEFCEGVQQILNAVSELLMHSRRRVAEDPQKYKKNFGEGWEGIEKKFGEIRDVTKPSS